MGRGTGIQMTSESINAALKQFNRRHETILSAEFNVKNVSFNAGGLKRILGCSFADGHTEPIISLHTVLCQAVIQQDPHTIMLSPSRAA
jgi:hypothetical protein